MKKSIKTKGVYEADLRPPLNKLTKSFNYFKTRKTNKFNLTKAKYKSSKIKYVSSKEESKSLR